MTLRSSVWFGDKTIIEIGKWKLRVVYFKRIETSSSRGRWEVGEKLSSSTFGMKIIWFSLFGEQDGDYGELLSCACNLLPACSSWYLPNLWSCLSETDKLAARGFTRERERNRPNHERKCQKVQRVKQPLGSSCLLLVCWSLDCCYSPMLSFDALLAVLFYLWFSRWAVLLAGIFFLPPRFLPY